MSETFQKEGKKEGRKLVHLGTCQAWRTIYTQSSSPGWKVASGTLKEMLVPYKTASDKVMRKENSRDGSTVRQDQVETIIV
jgi:hypothetical protein